MGGGFLQCSNGAFRWCYRVSLRLGFQIFIRSDSSCNRVEKLWAGEPSSKVWVAAFCNAATERFAGATGSRCVLGFRSSSDLIALATGWRSYGLVSRHPRYGWRLSAMQQRSVSLVLPGLVASWVSDLHQQTRARAKLPACATRHSRPACIARCAHGLESQANGG